MHKHLVVSFGLLSGLACVNAQPVLDTWRQDSAAAGVNNAAQAQAQAQRQAELRSALRAQGQSGAEMDRMRGERQLSTQERGELRQQLFQLRHEGVRK